MAARVAIEATCLTRPVRGGIARYVAALIEHLAPLARADDATLDVLVRWSRRRDLRRARPTLPEAPYRYWQDPVWPPRSRYGLQHCTDQWLPKLRAPRIVTVYDLFAMHADVDFDPAHRASLQARYRRFATQADWLIFISAGTRDDFFAHFQFPAERARVVHLGVAPEFGQATGADVARVREHWRLPARYFAFIGTAVPQKNLLTLLDAYERSGLAGDVGLVLVGAMNGPYGRQVSERIARITPAGAVHAPGYVPDADLPALLTGAEALLFPSLREGFGLPILEAMACGTPVLTSNAPGCAEVAGGHAVLVDPRSAAEMALGLRAVLQRTPAQRAAARTYATAKTWKQTALETWQVYRQALA